MFRLTSCLAVLALLASTARAVDIETVPVGNLGNAADMRYNLNERPEGFGRVDYAYNMGKYEVTAGQYTEFLNAVGGVDPYGLYNTNMWLHNYGCKIERSGSSPNYSYSVAADYANRPVNSVSWYDAAMFANWLTSGNVDNGAYNTATGDPVYWGDSNASNYTGIDRASAISTYGKVYVIPTEDEWYKAAYYTTDLDKDGTHDDPGYFDYPTSSNTAPGYVNNSGNLSGTGTPFTDGVTDPGNYATYDGDYDGSGGVAGLGYPYYRTEVGEWENSDSPYGTFDQGGNVSEKNETEISSHRGLRGGNFAVGSAALHASYRSYYSSTYENSMYLAGGFRVASIPEPGSITLLAFAALGLLAYGWRRV